MNNKGKALEVTEMIGPSKDFESIKKFDENGVEYWTARELMSVLGYSNWQNFEAVVIKAQKACVSSRQFPQDHFIDISKMIETAKSAIRKINDYRLDRYACYLIAQNGDSTKPQIALAQTYFAVQTRKQEIFQSYSESHKRVQLREDVSDKNRFLFSAAKQAGVSHFGLFNEAGYTGLYGMSLSQIEQKKDIKSGELLDRAGSEELGANWFRITQTEAKLKREQVKGDLDARKTHQQVGEKVRQTIKDLGGTMPENLKPERHIREVKRELKAAGRAGHKQLK